jgi:hypothetical protein
MWLQGKLVMFNDHPEGTVYGKKRVAIKLNYLELERWVAKTINAPLILKMWDIIFFAGKLHNGPFQGIFRGGQDFFDP